MGEYKATTTHIAREDSVKWKFIAVTISNLLTVFVSLNGDFTADCVLSVQDLWVDRGVVYSDRADA